MKVLCLVLLSVCLAICYGGSLKHEEAEKEGNEELWRWKIVHHHRHVCHYHHRYHYHHILHIHHIWHHHHVYHHHRYIHRHRYIHHHVYHHHVCPPGVTEDDMESPMLFGLVPLQNDKYLFTAALDGQEVFKKEVAPEESPEVCGSIDGEEVCAKLEEFEATPEGYHACVVADDAKMCFEAKVEKQGEITVTWE